ncbi:hypothetical protein SAMN05444064_113102 [Pseudomonas syringae]|nr:hypothetical protein SAMN05444514_112102 [Pseudomonas syringae]SFM30375.1 hypothetical protein SAMN05444064_113102 [Pseudomonas syringae]
MISIIIQITFHSFSSQPEIIKENARDARLAGLTSASRASL